MRRRVDIGLYALALLVTLITVARPFWVATYPPITDLPFHAAQTSVFRHWLDPSFHFREQFELAPLGVPYVSSYVLGALLMLLLPAVVAVKTATAIMLLAVPIGLAVLAWGTRKSPLLGLLGLPFVWCNLTHWGFINFVSALGMFAAALGLAIRLLDKPERRVQIALSIVLSVLFFTHVFRFPYAMLAIVFATASFYPVTKRWRPMLWPLLPPLGLFVLFMIARPAAVGGGASVAALKLEWSRLDQALGFVIGSFNDKDEAKVALRHLYVAGLVGAVSLGFRWTTWHETSRKDLAFEATSAGVVLACVLGLTLGYLVLPMEIGVWWYVYPREATAALFLTMALCPDLPVERWLRAALTLLMVWSAWSVSTVVVRNYRLFDESTRDFEEISRELPRAPKLLYLVFHHGGSTRKTTPYIHLPAYVQAERGGFLSFHFAVWGSSPVRYRSPDEPDAIVPPMVPPRWEWQPNLFQVTKHGPFFDWFLVRSLYDPGSLFLGDPSIHQVKHVGTWWLFHRE